MFFVQIAGRLGKKPETRFTPSGQKVTSFNIATNHRKGKEDVTIWVRITVWGEQLDRIISILDKGSAVMVSGRMTPPSSYTDKEGRGQMSLEVTAHAIEFSPFGREDRPEGQANNLGQTSSSYENGYSPSQANTPAYQEASTANSSYSRSNNSYGSANLTGQGGGNMDMDDEALPF